MSRIGARVLAVVMRHALPLRGSSRSTVLAIAAVSFARCTSTLAVEGSRAVVLTVDGSSSVRLVSVRSGKVLDVARGSVDDAAALQQWSYRGGDNQKWLPRRLRRRPRPSGRL